MGRVVHGQLAWGPQCMGFRSAGFRTGSDLSLGGRTGVPWGEGWCLWKFLLQTCSWISPLPSKAGSTGLLTPRVLQAPYAPAAAAKRAWFGAGLGFDRGMYAQINA